MSLFGKKWIIKNQNENLNVIAKLLQNRGINSPEKAEWFFNGTLTHLYDPRLLKEMDKAVERIKKAIADREKIMVFGDYDVDGITATAILYDFLKKAGADAYYTLPNREKDGYGLKEYFIHRFKEQGIGLLITVDCGTSNFNEIEVANQLGINVVVTDHHSMPEKLPNAVAVINPKRPDCSYPNKDICGSSIAFKLVSVLARELWDAEKAETHLDYLLSIVALGVVGDCMALTGENRILVKEGLKRLVDGKHQGILALLEQANLPTDKINSTVIGFQIGPRINAAGRIDDPIHAFELLIGNLEKAEILNKLNDRRKVVTKKYIDEAVAEINAMEKIPNIIVLKSKNWQSGLLGLIANGVAERYQRPAIAMQEKENEFVGSVRSVNDFDITSALRKGVGELFAAFGGHALAGGFTLPKKNIDEFLQKVEEIGNKEVDTSKCVSTLNIDCEILPNELSFETCNKINMLEPFGTQNPQPILLLKGVKILSIRPVGKESEHLQFPVQHGDKTVSAIAFRLAEHLDKINIGIPHDIACNIEINEWNGNRKMQLRVVDIKVSDNSK